MKKTMSVVITVLEVLTVVLCIVPEWANVKWNMNYEMWTHINFLDVSGWMNGYTATIVVTICAGIIILFAWAPVRKAIIFPSFIQVCIFLKTWYEVHHFSDSMGGSGYTDGNMLPLGIFHCILAIVVLVMGIRILFTKSE